MSQTGAGKLQPKQRPQHGKQLLQNSKLLSSEINNLAAFASLFQTRCHAKSQQAVYAMFVQNSALYIGRLSK
jgi:hypothetical protein